MEPDNTSKKFIWAGRAISGLVIIFNLFDGITKMLMMPQVVEATGKLGYPVHLIPYIGLTLLVCSALYIIPKTSVLGAILLTGYLGGAVASNLRAEMPFFSNVLFPVYFGILIWAGIFLRDPELRRFIPLKKKT